MKDGVDIYGCKELKLISLEANFLSDDEESDALSIKLLTSSLSTQVHGP